METRFNEGDHVQCNDVKPLTGNTVAPPLDLHKFYDVKQVHVCACGQEHIDVGITSNVNYVSCYKCREHLPKGELNHWCHSDRFTLIER